MKSPWLRDREYTELLSSPGSDLEGRTGDLECLLEGDVGLKNGRETLI